MNPKTLPRHPHTGLAAVGFWRGDQPIWPILGGAGDDATDDDDHKGPDDTDDDTGGGGTDDGQDDDKQLGPAGEKALQAEKAKRRSAQASLREFRDLNLTPAQIKKLLDDQKAGGKKADDVDVDEIRREARAAATTELMAERVLDKIEARAGKLFQDPDDAAALVMRGRSADDFLDDGTVDVQEIDAALKELLEKKPYLGTGAAQGGQKRFRGGADGGARKESRPEQLTRDDLKRMSPKDIETARREGRLDDVLGVKKT